MFKQQNQANIPFLKLLSQLIAVSPITPSQILINYLSTINKAVFIAKTNQLRIFASATKALSPHNLGLIAECCKSWLVKLFIVINFLEAENVGHLLLDFHEDTLGPILPVVEEVTVDSLVVTAPVICFLHITVRKNVVSDDLRFDCLLEYRLSIQLRMSQLFPFSLRDSECSCVNRRPDFFASGREYNDTRKDC